VRRLPIPVAGAFATVIAWTVAARVGGAPSKPAVPPVCGAAGACVVEPLSVPQALRSRAASLELSGLAWAPSLDRYLGVVDEGITIRGRLSFVFALDRSGAVDAEPVPIADDLGLDDVEALTPGPDQTFFLLTSHAPNRSGKVGKERRRLLQLRLEGRQLRVTGDLDLFEGKGEVPRQIEKLGLPRSTPVDLEGLAFSDGALYIGLKEPLLPGGSAIILRLDDPSGAFAAGKLPKKTLSFWGDVELTATSPAGAKVPQGIADLAFGPDGALYICANAPKSGSSDGGGALWRVARPRAGRMTAALLRRFPDLKPEGVAVGPAGKALGLVFDRDGAPPVWTTWPLSP
jgi:hypothetical protein